MRLMIILVVFLVFFLDKDIKAQQPLILNGGFEEHSIRYLNIYSFQYATDWNYVESPDYFHLNHVGNTLTLPSCTFAHVFPHSDSAIMGFATMLDRRPNYREYLTSELTEPLIVGVRYKLSFWLSNGDKDWAYKYKSNNIGIHFSTFPLSQNTLTIIPVIPQYNIDQVVWNTEWTEYTYTFVADSIHQHLTIGNFYPDHLTNYSRNLAHVDSITTVSAYYFIDDIFLEQLDRLEVNGSDTICEGDSTILSAKNSNQEYLWTDSNNANSVIYQGKNFTVSPKVTTTYKVFAGYDTTSFTIHVIPNLYSNIDLGESITLCQDELFTLKADFPNANYEWQDGSTEPTYLVSDSGWYQVQVSNDCGVGIDSIFIGERECFLHIPNAFTPNGDGQNDVFRPLGIDGVEIQEFRVYNRWGQEIYVGDDLEDDGWNGAFQGVEQAQDIYVYMIIYIRDRELKPTAIKGIVSLLR
jgi:gliding motility-associated-like protein